MINGLGVLGWGVGGIEAEAAMLGQPVTMLIPQVIGFKLDRAHCPPGATATDLVLTVTEMLRKKGVVDKFVEFFGDGLANLPLADRATIGNMSPEFGSTCAIFPIDEETIRYLRAVRPPGRADRAGRGLCQGPGHVARRTAAAQRTTPTCSNSISPRSSPASPGPKRPQDRVPLRIAKADLSRRAREAWSRNARRRIRPRPARPRSRSGGKTFELRDGAVLIAAITSCTNTSNPYVLIARGPAGAQRARARAGLASPGSRPAWRRVRAWSRTT